MPSTYRLRRRAPGGGKEGLETKIHRLVVKNRRMQILAVVATLLGTGISIYTLDGPFRSESEQRGTATGLAEAVTSTKPPPSGDGAETAPASCLATPDGLKGVPDLSGKYIVTLPSGPVIEAEEEMASTTGGNVSIAVDYIAARHQHWNLEEVGPGVYSIRSDASDLVLDVPHEFAIPGASLQLFTWKDGPNQKWLLEAIGPDTYQIRSAQAPELALAATDTDERLRRGLLALDCATEDPNEVWQLKPVS